MKRLLLIIGLVVLLCSLLPLPASAADPDYVIVGNTVSLSTSNGDILVTPHTLTASGWVEVKFRSKSFIGDVDISLGFNGVDQVQTVKAETWETYEHTKYRTVQKELVGSFKPKKIVGVKSLIKGEKKLNVGDSSNSKFADITYEIDDFTESAKTVTQAVAYESIIDGVITYKYIGDAQEPYYETYPDWKKSDNAFKQEIKSYAGSSKWQSKTHSEQVVKDAWYTARFWIDIPFKGGSTVSGKYNVAIKPASLTLDQAIATGNIVLLDPWYSTSWPYRKSYTISRASGAVTDYQFPLKIYYGSGTDGTESVEGITAGKMYTGSKCQTDFDDIRVTTSDGTTLCDIWLESKTDSNNAIFWIEHPSIGTGATTFYVYYGNAGASSASNGANTFIKFEDFEWGSDGDNLNTSGGSITWTTTVAGASKAEIDTGQYWSGTRSGDLYHDGANTSQATFDYTAASGTYAIRWRWRKDDAAKCYIRHGNGSYKIQFFFREDEKVYYYDGAEQDIGSTVNINTWYLCEVNNLNFTAGTYDIYLAGSCIKSAATMCSSATQQNVVNLLNNAGASEVWHDVIVIRNWRSTEPAWGSWGSEETGVPVVTTGLCTGFAKDWAIVNGTISSLGYPSATQIGFDYGLTSGYGSSVTQAGTYSTGTNYSLLLTGLTPGTVYHYRFKAYGALDWGYGSDATFATKGSAAKYECLDTGGDENSDDIYGANWTYQTFTTTTSHTISSVWLYVQRTGSPGTVTISIRRTAGGVPTGIDLGNVTATYNGNTFATSHSWYEFTFSPEVSLEASTKYAIVVRAVNGDNANDVQWRRASAGGLANGNTGYSTTSGSTWIEIAGKDMLFCNWGFTSMEIEDVKVFQTYRSSGDWLIAVRYRNLYPPYYDSYDVKKYFVLQFTDASSNVLAQTAVPAWGNRVGNIYLSASQVSPLTWGGSYRVRMYGTFSGNPYVEYALGSTDWLGSDLVNLDSWVISSASSIGSYYSTTLTTYLPQRGEVLTAQGGTVFDTGINGLSNVRPQLFSVYSTTTGYTPATQTHAGKTGLGTWQANVGTDGTVMLTRLGNLVGVEGDTVVVFITAIIVIMLMAMAFPAGHTTAACVLSLIPLVGAVWFGVDLVYIGILAIVAAFLFVKRFWIDTGT